MAAPDEITIGVLGLGVGHWHLKNYQTVPGVIIQALCEFMIHFNQRFRAEHQYFKALIDGGSLGEIYYASTGWRRMRGIPKFGGRFGQKKMSGGGPLIDLGVHMLDLTLAESPVVAVG